MSEPAPRDTRAAAEALLDEAETLLDDPVRAEQLAAAAWGILIAQRDDPEGRSFGALFRAAAVMLRSRRLARRLGDAEQVARRALPFLCVAPPVSEGRAALLHALAQLRRSERRYDEAAALFTHAAGVFAAAGVAQAEAACRGQAGMVLVEQQDGLRARPDLARARVLLDAGNAPALAARVGLALAWSNLVAGRSAQARVELQAARGLYERAPAAGEEVARVWWEGLIAALDGRVSEADDRLDAIRRQLLAQGSLREAARCTLDLLAARVKAGRRDGLHELGPDLLNAFKSPHALRPAEMIDLLAVFGDGDPHRYRSALSAIRQALASLSGYRGGRPDFIPALEDLADRLLCARPTSLSPTMQRRSPKGAMHAAT